MVKLFLALFLPLYGALFATEENQTVAALFNEANVTGTFVLYDIQQHSYVVHNAARAKQKFVPASTFKIANTLIGLATNSVKSVDEVLPYKGPEKPFIAAWKNDMSLRQAIAVSNVPIYQELARRIGLKKMRENIRLLHYGNERVGNNVERFWLDGPLKISALEQVRFLRKLTQLTLPYPKEIQRSVQNTLLLRETKTWRLYGKTGWYSAKDSGIGWFVGWLEKADRYYLFALNIDMLSIADAKKRVALVKESLKVMRLIE